MSVTKSLLLQSLKVHFVDVLPVAHKQFNPFNASYSKFLLFKGFKFMLVYPLFLIFDIRALWRSVLSARVPECHKLKIVGQTSMAKCNALMGSAVKGLIIGFG